MKNFYSALIAVLVFSTSAFSQTIDRPDNEISVSIGAVSIPYFAHMLGGVFGTAFTGGLAKVSDISSTGAISVEYLKYLGNHVAVGASLTNETASLTFDSYNGKDDNGNSSYKDGKPQRQNYTTVMPTVKIPWFYTDHVSMYSKAAIGGCLSLDTDSGSSDSDDKAQIMVGLQVTPIGIDFGGEKYRGFVEGGFGMQGLCVFGLRYSF